jgi:hypothetical protein
MTVDNAAGEANRQVTNAAGVRFTVRELHERVSVLEPGIVLMREIDRGSPETLAVIIDAIEAAAKDFQVYCLVLDLGDAAGSPLTGEYRSSIPRQFEGLHQRSRGRLKQIAVAFDANPVVRIISKFLIARMTNVPFVVYKSRATALEGARQALR